MGCAGRSLQAAQASRVHHLRGDILSESRRSDGSDGQTVNKTCDACSAKKRKCDGGNPCRRCVRWGGGHLCKYSRRRPYASSNQRSQAWPSSTGQKSNKITTARAKPCNGNSTGAHRIGRDQQEMRCVEASHQRPPDISKPPPATIVRLSTTNYDARTRLARARREAFELTASTTVESLEMELKASTEECIIPTVHGLDFGSQAVASSAFPLMEQSTIRTNMGVDIAKCAVPTFDDIVIDFDSRIYPQSHEYVTSVIPPSHARTPSLWELEDPISAEDWLEVAAG